MKQILPLIVCSMFLCCLSACRWSNGMPAEENNQGIVFLDTLHDFGVISQENPCDSFNFRFVNRTGADMMVLAVKTSCECTRATYPHIAVSDGDTSYIHVVYDGRGRGPEYVFRQIMVTTSNADKPYLLEIYGEVK